MALWQNKILTASRTMCILSLSEEFSHDLHNLYHRIGLGCWLLTLSLEMEMESAPWRL